MSVAPQAPLEQTAAHIAVDMQCVFAEPSEWFVPWLPKVPPDVLEIAERHPGTAVLGVRASF